MADTDLTGTPTEEPHVMDEVLSVGTGAAVGLGTAAGVQKQAVKWNKAEIKETEKTIHNLTNKSMAQLAANPAATKKAGKELAKEITHLNKLQESQQVLAAAKKDIFTAKGAKVAFHGNAKVKCIVLASAIAMTILTAGLLRSTHKSEGKRSFVEQENLRRAAAAQNLGPSI